MNTVNSKSETMRKLVEAEAALLAELIEIEDALAESSKELKFLRARLTRSGLRKSSTESVYNCIKNNPGIRASEINDLVTDVAQIGVIINWLDHHGYINKGEFSRLTVAKDFVVADHNKIGFTEKVRKALAEGNGLDIKQLSLLTGIHNSELGPVLYGMVKVGSLIKEGEKGSYKYRINPDWVDGRLRRG